MGEVSNPFVQLLAVAREVSFIKGAQLVRQGEASRGAFLIRSGACEARVALPGGGSLPGWGLGAVGAWYAMAADLACRGLAMAAIFLGARWARARV